MSKEGKMDYNIKRQHDNKKYHAIERISLLFDKGTFFEIGSRITRNDSNCQVPYDGVITGYGLVNGKCMYVFAQDFTLQGGSIGLYHGKKIAHIIELAIKGKCPVIGIYDSGGARISEGIDALAGCGKMMYYNTLASGYIPQISIVLGPCAGAAAYSPAISDFVFCVNTISNMYITGPTVIESVTGENCSAEELGGTKVHANITGVAHVICNSEKECFQKVRNLLDVLPANCHEEYKDKIELSFENNELNLDGIIPSESKMPYDIKKLIEQIVDCGSFIEIHENFATSLVVGFAKLCKCTIGIVANQPQNNGGALDCNSSVKGARFVRFCDAFNIPIITFVDTPGYLPGIDQEYNGIIRHGAKLLFAYAESSNVKITVVVRKAHGGAYIAMGSKHLGADRVYALPIAEIAVMGASGAVRIMNRKELESAMPEEYEEIYNRRVNEYKEKYLNTKLAVEQGYIDEIILLKGLKRRIANDLISLQKKESFIHVNKKHDNIPL